MTRWDRRRFINTVGIAAGGGLIGWNVVGSRGLFAQQSVAGIPDEILNPVEVSGPEAEPILGKPPGQKRMYMLPSDAGEHHRVGSQVMKRIARREDTSDVHELATFTGNAGATMPRYTSQQSRRRAGDAWGDRVRTCRRSLDDDARRFCEPASGDASRLDDEVQWRPVGVVLDEPSGRCCVCGHGRTAGWRAGSASTRRRSPAHVLQSLGSRRDRRPVPNGCAGASTRRH